MRSLELEETEALLLTVALREYLKGGTQTELKDHPTSRSVIEKVVEKLDPPKGAA